MINKFVYKFLKKYQFISVEELKSEANLIYCNCLTTFEEERSSFSTYLHNNLFYGLSMFCKKQLNIYKDINFIEDQETEFGAMCNFINGVEFGFFSESLSTPAREIVKIITDPPAELFECFARKDDSKWAFKLTKHTITKYLKSKNWNSKNINNSFCEIKNSLFVYNNI